MTTISAEDKRHALHDAAIRSLGREEATTLMEHLPPVGWADVATKQDLELVKSDIAHLREHLDQRFELMDQRFGLTEARFDAKLERTLRLESYRTIGGMGLLLTLFSAVQHLIT